MYVTRYEPRNFFREMSEEFNRLFSGRLGTYLPLDETSLSESGWLPAVDIKEEDNRFLVRADLPGVDPKDVEITCRTARFPSRASASPRLNRTAKITAAWSAYTGNSTAASPCRIPPTPTRSAPSTTRVCSRSRSASPKRANPSVLP